MYHNNKVIATICARGGSKGVPNKNIRPILGKPLLLYTLEQVKALPWVDRIVVSTDSEAIKEVATTANIEVPFLRPSEFAQDDSPKIPAILCAISQAEQTWKEQYDIVLDLDPTSPLRGLDDIEAVMQMLMQPRTEIVVTATPSYKNPYFNMIEQTKTGYIKRVKQPKKIITRRQDAPKVYDMNASIYGMKISALKKWQTYFTPKTRVHIMAEDRSIDIDRPIDFLLVEHVLQLRSHENN